MDQRDIESAFRYYLDLTGDKRTAATLALAVAVVDISDNLEASIRNAIKDALDKEPLDILTMLQSPEAGRNA